MKLHELTIENFKNVKFGRITVPEKQSGQGASMLGIYGQNGTGKTAVIDALTIFRQLVHGDNIPERLANFICGNSASRFVFTFIFNNSDFNRKYTIEYEILFHAESSEPDPLSFTPSNEHSLHCVINSERLRFSAIDKDGSKIRMHDICGASQEKEVWPKGFWNTLDKYRSAPEINKQIETMQQALEDCGKMITLTKNDMDNAKGYNESLEELKAFEKEICEIISRLKTDKDDLKNVTILHPRECHQDAKSFIFQKAIQKLVSQGIRDNNDLASIINAILSQEIAISGTIDEAYLSFNKLPFYTVRDPFNSTRILHHSTREDQYSIKTHTSNNRVDPIITALQLDPHETHDIDNGDIETVSRTLPFLNIIVGSIIPGLSIEAHSWGPDQDGISEIQWYAMRELADGDFYRIPLANESRGIQRIVSWAMLLVHVYNEPEFIAVIDEIDAGIFEYLLGEVLSIIESEGRGQLIFTSHNLRPLEMLDKTSVVFTTTNPNNRYLRLKNVKATNNLRDMYFRAITLDTQDEPLYDYVSRARLGSAFSKAHQDNKKYLNNTLVDVITAQETVDEEPFTEEDIADIHNILNRSFLESDDSNGQ